MAAVSVDYMLGHYWEQMLALLLVLRLDQLLDLMMATMCFQLDCRSAFVLDQLLDRLLETQLDQKLVIALDSMCLLKYLLHSQCMHSICDKNDIANYHAGTHIFDILSYNLSMHQFGCCMLQNHKCQFLQSHYYMLPCL